MPKAAGNNAERLSALIAGIEAEAYERGRADARKELLDRLQPDGGRTGTKAARGKAAGKAASTGKRTGRGKRAPRGSLRPFVERVLGERPGTTAAEIPGLAASDTERSIKLSSIRVELLNGRRQGRYVSDGGRWSLSVSDASPAAPEDAASSEPPPGSAPAAGEAGSDVPPDEGGAAAPDDGEGERGKPLGLNL